MKYPEHEKLDKVKNESQIIGEFLEFLQKNRTICYFYEEDERWYPCRESTEELLAEYFGIDTNKLEEEKRQMLAKIRKLV